MLVLTFQIGDERLALDVRRIREVVPRVRLQRVARSPAWLAGVFIYRGQVVTVIDLHRLVGAGECPPHLSSRIILVPQAFESGERLLGLLAAEVADIRDMQPPAADARRAGASDQPDFGPVLVDGEDIVHFVDLDRLLPESYKSRLAIVPRELPA